VNPRRRFVPAELVTFLVSLAVLLGLVAAIVVLWIDGQSPASVSVRQEAVRRDGDVHLVEVVVRNDGDDTASNVQVLATLTIEGEVTEGEQVVDFLAGEEAETLVFAFSDDPADGELELEVSSYTDP